MKSKLRRPLLIALGVLVLLVIVAVVMLPRWVDAESYRGLLRSKLERQLGREVEFGAMKLSLWPVLGLRLDDLAIGRTPAERFDRPIVAESLRVGARLAPLLRGRLEVTSLVVERPVLSFYHRDDGTWEPVLTAGGDSTTVEGTDGASRKTEAAPAATGGAPLVIERLRVTRGRVVLRRDDAGELRETALDDLELRLDGLGTRGPISFELATGVGGSGTLRGDGEFQPADAAGGRPLQLSAQVELGEMAPSTLSDWLAVLAPTVTLPDGLLADRDPAVIELSPLRVKLRQPQPDAPIEIDLDVQVGSGRGGRLALLGKLGPLGDDPAAIPLDLSMKLTAVALDGLRFLLPAMESLDVSKATAAADLRLSGSFKRQLEVGGDLSIADAKVSFPSPQGAARTLPFALRARGDVRLRDSAARIEFPKLELELPREDANRTLTLRGSVDASSDPAKVDLELLPTSVAADDLAALAALFAPDAPLSFASPDPVELEMRVRGALGGATLPDLEGRAKLSSFTFRFAGMTQPMEKVAATVAFSPRQVTLDGLGGVIGKSDVTAGRVVITNFAAPRVQLDLNSRNADFWELFSFVESDETPAGATPIPATEDDPLARLTIEGKLSIERGSLQTLTFEQLETGMDFRAGILTLAPLEMTLYNGRFAGKLVQDLNTGVLTISGTGSGVDADGFLAQNLALGGVIAGRASTELNLQVRETDPANVLAGVSGGGPLQLVDGRLAKLDVLKSLSKVTGIFGERSLQRLTKQLAKTGTPFSRAETRLSFNAGALALEDLVIETAELTLAGRASLESATGKLDGRFVVAFSPELSAEMRAEQSRAASLFWDPKAQRVSFAFGVSGPATAPSVGVDWDAALRGVAERKLEDRLRGLLGRQPEAGATEGAPAADSGTTAGEPQGTAGSTDAAESAPAGSASTQPETGEPSPSTPGLVAEVTRARWTGPVLLRDLSLEGTVRGAGIERASLAVVDARGIEVQRIDRLRPVDDQLASVTDREAETTLSWSAKIDGKRLMAAGFPVKATVTVYDRQGRSASASREVDR